MVGRILTIGALVVFAKNVHGQTADPVIPFPFPGDAPSSVERLATLRDSTHAPAILWRGSTPRPLAAVGSAHPEGRRWDTGIFLLPVQLRTESNSGYVVDRNNGSLWGGRGVNSQLSAGVGLRQGPISLKIQPELNYHQNRDLEIRPTATPFRNPFYPGIDLPQRFGPEPFAAASLGQSFARVDFSWAGLGVATENLWWGVGLRESIVLSNTAAGFPHAFLEMNRPVDIGIGYLTTSAFWGRLSESMYFDTVGSNDHRLLAGAGLLLQPRGARNLTLGFTRLFTYDWDSLSVGRFVPFLAPFLKEQLISSGQPGGEDASDQRLSVFVHYRILNPGFEVYGEFGREDHSWDLRDLVGEPDHSAAYLIGFQRLMQMSGKRSLRVQGEWLNLQNLRATSPDRNTAVYYNHLPQGHTQLGQMLGAGIGPGAESQFLGVDVLSDGHAIGGFVERVRRDEMSGPARASRLTWPPKHDVEMTGGVRGYWQATALDISGQLSYSHRLQRTFIDDDRNLSLVVQATWRP